MGLSVVFLLHLFLLKGFSGAEECQSRDYGNGGTVCVCNANHCDTISKPEKVDRPHYVVYTSNKAGLRFTKKEETFLEKSKTYQKQIVINSTRTFQQIFGWGSTFTDATGININSLDTKQQENLLKSYFSEDGLEYNLCRVPMGASDYSTHAYTYDDGETDEELTNFRLAPEDFQFKIPHIKSAQNFSNGNLQLFASAWIAPIWMEVLKAGKRFKVLKTEMYQPWANYFVKFLDNYRKEGIEFWGITTGNEPTANAKVTSVKEVNSVAWNPFTMMPWILGSLGPTIRNSDYSNINIMVLEDQRYFSTGFIKLLLKNNSTRHYVDGIAMHWYYNKVLLFADLFAEIARKFPEKFVLATESSEAVDNEIKKRGSVDLGSWDNGEAYTNDLIKNILNRIVGSVTMNMALDLTGGPTYAHSSLHSTIIVNATAEEFYKQPVYYQIAHFSKFIPKGSVRIYSSKFNSDVPVVAFKRPDNGTVVVLLNKKKKVVPVAIVDSSRGAAEMELSAKSITTLLYW